MAKRTATKSDGIQELRDKEGRVRIRLEATEDGGRLRSELSKKRAGE